MCIADDLIVAGATDEEHDAAFTKLMDTAKKKTMLDLTPLSCSPSRRKSTSMATLSQRMD